MEKDLSTWVETKTADNKVYYYNSATRETSWKRPENVRIVKYDQLMAAAMAATMASTATASTIVAATPIATSNNNITSTNTTTSSIANNTANNHPSLLDAAIAPVARPIGHLATETPAEILAAKPQLLLATAASSQVAPAITATAAPAAALVSTTISTITTTNNKNSDQSNQSTLTSVTGISSSTINNDNSGKSFSRGSISVSNNNNSSNSNFCNKNNSNNNNGNTNTSSSSTTTTTTNNNNNNKKEGMKPVSTTAIPGTAWCVVWTDKNRVFYFNPSTKTSVWDRPAELRNRDDVDKIISNPPPIVLQQQNKQQQQQDQDSSSSNGDQHEQAEKKVKLDNSNSNTTNCSSLDSASATNSTANSTTTNTTTTSTSSNTTLKPTIAPKIVRKEVATEMEKEAAKKRETISFEERVETFRQMLEEKEVNPSSTFQKELSKIVFDPRYLLLTSSERRETFEKYCLEKGEEERKARREKMKKAAESFKELLKEASLTSRSIYEDFHDKYSKDPRYRALERTKDREILFDDHLAMLRRKEREERSQSKRSERHHIKRKRSIAEENFRQLLRETKLIDKDTRRKIEESEHQHLIDIIGTLQNHKRYLDLEPYSEKRRKILLNYIEELAASNP